MKRYVQEWVNRAGKNLDQATSDLIIEQVCQRLALERLPLESIPDERIIEGRLKVRARELCLDYVGVGQATQVAILLLTKYLPHEVAMEARHMKRDGLPDPWCHLLHWDSVDWDRVEAAFA